MPTQKLYKNGNSVAVTIPKQFLKELFLKDGSQVFVEKRGNELVITPQKNSLIPDIDVEFAKELGEFMDEHREILEELSRR